MKGTPDQTTGNSTPGRICSWKARTRYWRTRQKSPGARGTNLGNAVRTSTKEFAPAAVGREAGDAGKASWPEAHEEGDTAHGADAAADRELPAAAPLRKARPLHHPIVEPL